MHVTDRVAGDIERLETLIRAETRDRYRMALLALRGEEKLDIAAALGVPRAPSKVGRPLPRRRDRESHAATGRGGDAHAPARTPPPATPRSSTAGEPGVCVPRSGPPARSMRSSPAASYRAGIGESVRRSLLTRVRPCRGRRCFGRRVAGRVSAQSGPRRGIGPVSSRRRPKRRDERSGSGSCCDSAGEGGIATTPTQTTIARGSA